MTRTTPPPTGLEDQMLGALRNWAGRYCPDLLLSDLRKAAALCAAVAVPVRRPVDRELRVQPERPAGAPRNRRPVNNMPAVIPEPPDGSAAGLECDAVDCPESSVGWRFYRAEGWLLACVRHMSGAGPAVRRMDAEQRATFGPGDAGAGSAAVCPSAASGPSDEARGASGAVRASEGPSGAFPAPEAARPVQEAPGKQGPQPPDGPAGQGSPSGPTRSAEAHTEPHSPSAPQAATQAATQAVQA